jgi:hypothetical protein
LCTAELQNKDPMLLDACGLEAAVLVTTSPALLNATGMQGARLASTLNTNQPRSRRTVGVHSDPKLSELVHNTLPALATPIGSFV